MVPRIRQFIIPALFLVLFRHYAFAEKCTVCHKESFRFSAFHSPYTVSCEQCHGGNPDAENKETAHFGMEAYPGRMATVKKSCGQAGCHADLVPLVENSIMNTVDGMISVTRKVYNEQKEDNKSLKMSDRLDNQGADSYLRKLCVSCHLGSERKNHSQSFRDRGGGCSACHLQTYQPLKVIEGLSDNPDITGFNKTHPTLSVAISNDRCFGCHARSGRISLNYRGLAEVESLDESRIDDFRRLYDGRLVEKKAEDIHSTAGMVCIDCHTAAGLMGTGKRVEYLRYQTDIQCGDCHNESLKTRRFDQLDPRERKYVALYRDRIPLPSMDSIIVTEKNESPLFHMQQRGDKRILYSKNSGKEMEVPVMKKEYYHQTDGHERLSCDSCHTAWAPQCYGCHVTFDPSGEQWDHTQGKLTKGRWVETRWFVKSELPTLGVFEEETITTFVPGMNLIVKKSPDAEPFEKRLFSATSAHTTQKGSRDCESCHRSDLALGIIRHSVAHPEQKQWETPIGWIEESSKKPGSATKPKDRSLNSEEIKRIKMVGTCLECHLKDDKIYQSFKHSLKNRVSACRVDSSRSFLQK